MQKNRCFHKNCAKITITKSLLFLVILYVKYRTNLQLHQKKEPTEQVGFFFGARGGEMRTTGSTKSRFCKRSETKSSGMPRRHKVPRESPTPTKKRTDRAGRFFV